MKKHRNPLAYLGWLGFIGVLGMLVAPALDLMVFLLFFFFFSYRRMAPDELFWQNVRRAGLGAFAAGTALLGIWRLALTCRGFLLSGKGLLFSSPEELAAAKEAAMTADTVTVPAGVYSQSVLMSAGISWTLLVSLSTFVVTLMVFNRREKRNLEESRPC